MSRKRAKFGIGKLLGIIVLAAVLLLVGAFLVLTLREYRPAEVETVRVPDGGQKIGKSFTVLSFNVGYAALGEDADFFMDGGKTSRPESADIVHSNLDGIVEVITQSGADVVMLQEVDTDSTRTFKINEAELLANGLGIPYAFAFNYSADFVPYPVTQMLGRVHSGLATYTGCAVSSAERVQLPVPFSWPMRCFNLKRCLLVSRMPVEGSDKELVLVNLHLEAYDDGEGRAAQTAMLYDFIEKEYQKGNYVIAGGDFNQTFPNAYYFPSVKEGNWMPNVLDENVPEGFTILCGEGQTPTCRLLDVPYRGNDKPQYYIIDGFIVSDNMTVDSIEVVDQGFRYSDHQPVRLSVTLAN